MILAIPGQELLVKVRSDTVAASRDNFILERELHDIDDKIKLLILNRISVQDVMASSVGLQRNTAAQVCIKSGEHKG